MSSILALVIAVAICLISVVLAYYNGKKAERLSSIKRLKKEVERFYETNKTVSDMPINTIRERLRNIRKK